MKSLLKVAALSLVLMFSSCSDETDCCGPGVSDTTAGNFGSEVARDFVGHVVDLNDLAVAGASVKIGNTTVQTDSNGLFIMRDATVFEKFAYVTVTKPGYHSGSRALVPTNGINNVKVMLIPSEPIEIIPSGETSEVQLANGTKVTFDGAFQDAEGNAYSGEVQVAMYHLAADNQNLGSIMPGSLYAETDTGAEAILETYGMMKVGLTGAAGQKLQIAQGHIAEISMRIADAQLASAPQSIPLWHFDEAKGYWIQEGFATKQGSFYVGEVSHFSWWNCDAPFPLVELDVTIVDQQNVPVSHAGVKIIMNGSFSPIAYTDNNGNISGLIPSNQQLSLQVLSECGVVYTTTIGPFDSNAALPPIVIPGSGTTIVQGILNNCNGAAVTNGFVMFHYQNQWIYAAVTNGSFSLSSLYCENDFNFTVYGYDLDEQQSTPIYEGNISETQTDVGILTTCTANTGINLAGLYTVVVTRNDTGTVKTFNNEMIILVANNHYKTTTTAQFDPGLLSAATDGEGFFFQADANMLTVPSQQLAGVYSNILKGLSDQGDDGAIADANSFTLTYGIYFNNNTILRTYTAVYTRN